MFTSHIRKPGCDYHLVQWKHMCGQLLGRNRRQSITYEIPPGISFTTPKLVKKLIRVGWSDDFGTRELWRVMKAEPWGGRCKACPRNTAATAIPAPAAEGVSLRGWCSLGRNLWEIHHWLEQQQGGSQGCQTQEVALSQHEEKLLI